MCFYVSGISSFLFIGWRVACALVPQHVSTLAFALPTSTLLN